MLAQQEGPSSADQRSREPLLATLAGCILLSSLVCILHKSYDTSDLDGVVQQLRALTEVNDQAELKALLGDPETKNANERTPKLITQLNERIMGEKDDDIHTEVGELQRMWNRQDVNGVKKRASNVLVFMQKQRDAHGSLNLYEVPGKHKTPGHRQPGRLPASNVAAIGKTLFSDYLVAVELAAALLLVATIGAIAIAGRKSEELR